MLICECMVSHLSHYYLENEASEKKKNVFNKSITSRSENRKYVKTLPFSNKHRRVKSVADSCLKESAARGEESGLIVYGDDRVEKP